MSCRPDLYSEPAFLETMPSRPRSPPLMASRIRAFARRIRFAGLTWHPFYESVIGILGLSQQSRERHQKAAEAGSQPARSLRRQRASCRSNHRAHARHLPERPLAPSVGRNKADDQAARTTQMYAFYGRIGYSKYLFLRYGYPFASFQGQPPIWAQPIGDREPLRLPKRKPLTRPPLGCHGVCSLGPNSRICRCPAASNDDSGCHETGCGRFPRPSMQLTKYLRTVSLSGRGISGREWYGDQVSSLGASSRTAK
jgi:hypothetical protein